MGGLRIDVRVVVLGLAALAALLLLGAALDYAGAPMVELLRDPSNAPGDAFYRGAISNAGLMVWGATATTILWAGLLADRSALRFYLVTAAGVLYLGIDDAWLIHEAFAPRVLGVPEKAVYALYAVGLAAYALTSWRALLRTRLDLAGLAALGFAGQIVLDTFDGLPVLEDIEVLGVLEDVSKYYGLAALFVWAVALLLDVFPQTPPEPTDRPTLRRDAEPADAASRPTGPPGSDASTAAGSAP